MNILFNYKLLIYYGYALFNYKLLTRITPRKKKKLKLYNYKTCI